MPQCNDGQQGGPENKKKIKCKHFPNCTLSAENCPFVHPTEACKYFPACRMGDKCIYLHPEEDCKFGLKCTRVNCTYKHPKGFKIGGPGKFPIGGMPNMNNPMQMMAALAMASAMSSSIPPRGRGKPR